MHEISGHIYAFRFKGGGDLKIQILVEEDPQIICWIFYVFAY